MSFKSYLRHYNDTGDMRKLIVDTKSPISGGECAGDGGRVPPGILHYKAELKHLARYQDSVQVDVGLAETRVLGTWKTLDFHNVTAEI